MAVEQHTARRFGNAGARLAEGPLWDSVDQCLYWTDIDGRTLHRVDLDGTETVVLDGYEVTGFGLRAAGGLVLALPDRFAVLERGAATPRTLAEVPAARPGMRLNDAACDPAGRLWSGTMARDLRPGLAHLYCLEPNGEVRTMVDGVGLSNGIDWSGDGRFMYYVDSLAGTVDRFDFDPDSGRIGGRRRVLDVDGFSTEPGRMVVADGLCVDADDCLWVAVHGAGEVRRFAPTGALLARVSLPLSGVTSCTFGGPDLDILFITAAATGSASGGVFQVSLGQKGREPDRFRG